ncbi:MAG: RDD family protein [Clostridia bacterium]|nr:RDD family protein [Oscillospiraceae bacterium]MBR4893232.1 RDD family protein [Clostridia bacterium]
MKKVIRRMYAGIIDMFFIGLPVYAIYHTFILESMKDVTFKISYLEVNMNLTAITLVFLFLYYAVCEVLGQSIGKKMLGIKVKYNGKKVIAKILRPIIKVLILYFAFPLVALCLFLPDNKMFYDFFLKTEIEEVKVDVSKRSLK